ncbi:tyrosine-type recombinase/integrase [Spongiibacter nanhainus]|uniref:Tyrosine-type recombinase/integrase n=1 Tax=Spongiibacter nanhainus TaxID=2794344 RepID=A0A7T4URT7_9GAMM|nr:tyrosine-type recombinase/integrase [Spongiibacter nanhainus]QQD18725.1 tyrosine-type recombinase/integrase [Spongiibacter nanhainus]
MAAREAITTTTLKKFLSGPTPAKDQYLRAPDGLGVRRFKGSDKASFIVEAKVRGQGRARRITIGPAEPELLNEAKEKARVIVARLRSGEDVTATQKAAQSKEVQSRVTVLNALQQLLETRTELKPSTQRDYRSSITNHAGPLLRSRITDLNIDNVRRQLRRVEREKSQATSAKLRRALSAVIGFAVSEYGLEMANPVASLKGVAQTVKGKEGFVPDTHVGQLVRELFALRSKHRTHGNFLLFVLLTGCRKSEAMQLCWDDVNWGMETVTFRNTKNKRDHELPMTCLMYLILRRQDEIRRGSNPWVFPGRVNGTRLTDVRKTILNSISPEVLWTPQRERGRCLQVHDLRRTAATHMVSAGIPQETISLILNHSRSNITERYIQNSYDTLMQALETYQLWLLERSKEEADGRRTRRQKLTPEHEELLRALGANPQSEILSENNETEQKANTTQSRHQTGRRVIRIGGNPIDPYREPFEHRFRDLVGFYADGQTIANLTICSKPPRSFQDLMRLSDREFIALTEDLFYQRRKDEAMKGAQVKSELELLQERRTFLSSH